MTSDSVDDPGLGPSEKLKVLLVEDEEYAGRFLSDILTARGYDVTWRPNAEEAWEVYQREVHPLVILDWVLPGMSGVELCRHMREEPYGETSVILMVTVRNHPDELQEILEAGADDYLSKPVNLGLLDVRLTIAERGVKNHALRKQVEKERRHLEAQIQHTQKLDGLGVLAGGIAHDFNNLLTSIVANAGLARMELPSDSPVQPNIEQIETAGERAAELTNQLLTYSGKKQPVKEPLDLSHLIDEMGHLLKTVISKGAVLEYHFHDDLPAIKGDSSQVCQVVMNLITNASEALGEKNGIIQISSGILEADRSYLSEILLGEDLPEGRYVFLEVSDTGVGMDEEIKSRIFDPFFTTKSTGHGLGLATLFGIIRGHQGAIEVQSEPGRGTSFKVLFPRMGPPGTVRAGISSKIQDWRGSGVILVIDDEDGVRAVLKIMLEKFGFTTLTASDGPEGVEIFRRHVDEIRAVVLDWTMPHMNGEAVFKEIRRIHPDACVLLSSGYPEEDTSKRFAGDSPAGFLQKPYGPMTLIKMLREVFQE